MKEEDVINELLRLKEFDGETAHIEADEILCRFLSSLGYGIIVKIYNNIEKWYS